ncbi:selenium-binding protein SBP56-related protein [Sulfuracidifex metallicus]|uniref:selenium-binding protein SBP56-related protein n=1 Tax=Sulfuracidifex metallicus TaxID=47303 RepID=UPI0022743EC6|nr:selenium-binding protein SBP56-related protein [Sulfuracidifex metallicus]MCY0849713.1 selenium-binding protein [Sulfuracidifex metallicus]
MIPLRSDPTFYPSPRSAIEAKPEELAYVGCLYEGTGIQRPDFVAVVDVKPKSPSYSKVVGRVELPYVGDELHHFGWNACSSALCPNGTPGIERRYLVVPGLRSSRIYIIDVKRNQRRPEIVKVIQSETVKERTGYSRLHTVHCGPNGIYISAFGNVQGDGPGGILVLDHYTFDVLGRWELDRGDQYLSYDFWWNLPNEVMVTSEWGVPNTIEDGLKLEHLKERYGNRIHFWDLRKRKKLASIVLGEENRMALELRPFHDPTKMMGYVNVVISMKDLSSSIWLWYRDGKKWNAEKVITIEAEKGEGQLPEILKPFKMIPPLVTDIDLSLDDRYLYVSCWGTGDVKKYDVSDPFHPVLVSKVKVGGISQEFHHPRGDVLIGGPQMLEVSRDGKRVYITNSLYSTWDNQFYGNIKGWMVKLDSENNGLSLDKEFLVDFGEARAHQTRLGGGDASSDSYCYP